MNPAVRSIQQMSAMPRAEFEQAIFRVFIPGLVLICFIGYWLFGGALSENERHALWFTIGFMIFGIAIALHIIATHDVSVVRRYVGNVADIVGITYFMLVTGEQGAAVFFLYLWITFGNRLRYGRRAMAVSQLMSQIGLLVVSLQ